MCGIFGIINTKEKIDENRVLAVRDVLTHCEPEDEDIYISNHSNTILARRGELNIDRVHCGRYLFAQNISIEHMIILHFCDRFSQLSETFIYDYKAEVERLIGPEAISVKVN